jgi:hypothetical protein
MGSPLALLQDNDQRGAQRLMDAKAGLVITEATRASAVGVAQ